MIKKGATEKWTFFTNHGHVLFCIAGDPRIRLADVAARVGITERSAQRIVADLIGAGYLKPKKSGRRNQYQVRADLPLRHPLERENTIGALLELLGRKLRPATKAGRRSPARKPARRSASIRR